MKMNRKAEGGFMESMVSMMIVVISLTAFLSLVPMAFAENERERDIPEDILSGLEVTGGTLTSGIDLEGFVRDNGYCSLKLTVRIIGTGDVLSIEIGQSDSDEMRYDHGTILIPVDTKKMNAEYELAVWI